METEKRWYHAIEKSGYGNRTRYQIRRIYKSGLSVPVTTTEETYRTYKTEAAARDAARAAGIEIEATGDYYEILAKINGRIPA